MAARTRRTRIDDEHRARIQTSQLVNRLYGNAMGEIELTQQQVRSIEILLKKTLPDLSAVELSGDGDNPIALGIAWLNSPTTTSLESHITPESSSSPSTTEPNDLPASSAIAEPGKP